ncbi:MAG: hypothetical protein AMXMBFR44_1960 [Candidatus Campbellbacteria bacterium]
MAKTMIASSVTDGQIDNIVARLRDALRKHRGAFDSEVVQIVLGLENLGMHLLEPFQALVNAESVWYPIWVCEHLTPQFEVRVLCNPGSIGLWPDPNQKIGDPYPTGHEVYESVRANGFLEKSLSYGNLKFLERDPCHIPDDWRERRLKIHAWASVVLDRDGNRCVPYLHCQTIQPYTGWRQLDDKWVEGWSVGLRM